MNHTRLCTAVLTLGLTGAASGQLVVGETYTNLENRLLTNVPVTFSRVGGDGDFALGITPRVGGVERPAQVDVLRRASDGSIRHALVSFVLPSVPASGNVAIDWLNKSPQAPAAFNWAGHNTAPPPLSLQLSSQAYGNLVSNLGAQLQAQGWYGPQMRVLHDGSVMKEFEWADVPAGQPANQFVKVFWRVRLFSGQSSMRVEAIVENCNPRVMNTATPLHYPFLGVTLWHNGSILYQTGAYDHVDRTRYRIVAWTAGKIEDIHRKPSFQYLYQNKFVPPYQLNNNAPPQYRNMTAASADAVYTAQVDGRNDDVRPQGILEQGIIFDFMGGTGGRWDIGLYPAWTVTYLLTHAPGIYQRILHADGNGAGSYYIHVRSDQGHPGYNVLTLPSGRRPLDNIHRIDPYQFTWSPDHAHAPSLGYMAYILTGDEYYAEEMSFWASYQLGEFPYVGMNINSAERDQAWSFRHVVDAAFLMPDGHPLLAYFVDRINAYTNTLITTRVNSGRPIHFMSEQADSSGRLEWVNCYFSSPWQVSWLVASAGNAVDKGFPQLEPFRDWLAEYIVGFYISKNNPAHDFVGPDGITYKYDPMDAMAYSSATSLWTTEVYMYNNGTPANAADDVLATRKLAKVRNFSKYGEIWYYNKVNQDNEWAFGATASRPPGLDPAMPLPQGLDLLQLPDNTIGNWPLRANGWGHGRYYWHAVNPPFQGWWYNWHRYGAWDGLVSCLNGNVPGATEAWQEMLLYAPGTDYGFEMVAQSGAPPPGPPPGPPPANLVRLDVTPHTMAASPGSFVDYHATAIYRDSAGVETSVDVTASVSWQSGNTAVATFSGVRLSVIGQGLAVIRATLNNTTVTNSRPALMVGTTDHKPVILYAGWDDTYAIKGKASRVKMMARVADLDSDIMSVSVLLGGMPVLSLRDDATQGDAIAGDGVYTWSGDRVYRAAGDVYYEIVALDTAVRQSNPWPYLTVGSPSRPRANSGFRTMPFPSENYSRTMTRLRGVGLGLTNLQPNVSSVVSMLAEGAGDPVDRIYPYLDGSSVKLGTGLNDAGIAPDQFAGDGLYAGQATVRLAAGSHRIDMMPLRNGTPLTGPGDAYPRFRVHAHAPGR